MSAIFVLGDNVDAFAAARYLARAGHEVTMARERVNGIGDTLEPGWLPPHIAHDLDLAAHGLVVRTADPWASVLPEDGGLELSRDIARSAEYIKRLSPPDAARWP